MYVDLHIIFMQNKYAYLFASKELINVQIIIFYIYLFVYAENVN